MSEREVSFDALKEAMAGIVTPEEREGTLQKAVKPMREMIGWHTFSSVGYLLAIALLLQAILSENNLFTVVSIIIALVAAGGTFFVYFKVKELAGYSRFFDKAAEFMLWGRGISPVLPNLCYGFREMVRDKDTKLYARWNTYAGPAYVISVVAIILFLIAICVMDSVWSWIFAGAALLIFAIREFRYLYGVYLTMKALQKVNLQS